MTTVRLLFATAGSLLLALIAAVFKEDIEMEWWQGSLIAAFSLVIGLVGAYRFRQTRSIYRQYFASLQLLAAVERLAPLLRLYQQGTR